MKVKVCPKCGAENNEARQSCSNCYASLGGVEPTESTREPITIPQGAGREPRPPKGEPQSPPSDEPAKAENPLSDRPGAESPSRSPFYYPEPPPAVKQGSKAGWIVLVVVILAAAAFGGWYFLLRQPGPAEVVLSFINACEAGDTEKAMSFLSKTTLDFPGGKGGFVKGFITVRELAQEKGKKPTGTKVKILGTSYEGPDKSTAVVASQPLDEKGQPEAGGVKISWVLVKEEGAWKIDVFKMWQKMLPEILRHMSEKQPKAAPALPSFPGKP